MLPLKTARRASAAIASIASHDLQLKALKNEGTKARIRSSRALPNSVFELKQSLERRGFVVHFAADSEEASRIVTTIARRHRVRTAVKSKSMATEEIRLNPALQSAGIEVVETDLGEFIVQLAGERPAHILAPAINKKASDVARLFVAKGIASPEEIDTEQPDKEVLTALARRHLRSVFLSADMGITGANFACAKEGVLVGISNEGNLRMCVSLPPIHVALVPIEKIVTSLAEVATLLPLLTMTATAQPLTSYVSLIAGPRISSESDGPLESHVVLVDNGRSRLAGTRYEPVLRCVRCGACLNACPVYTTMGGHAYGTTYMGPIGAVLATLIEEKGPSQLPYASSLCGACTEICPVSIPLHEMLYELRADPRHGRQGLLFRALFSAWAKTWDSPRGFWMSQSLAARLRDFASRAGLGKIRSGGPGNSASLVLSDNLLGKLTKRVLRRSEIFLPAPPTASPGLVPREAGTRRRVDLFELVGSSWNTSPTTSASTRPSEGDLAESRLPHEQVAPSTHDSSRRALEPSRGRDVVETFLLNLARNGFRAERVSKKVLAKRVGEILDDGKVVAIDEEVLETAYGKRIGAVLKDRGSILLGSGSGGLDSAAKADLGVASPMLGIAATGSLLFHFGPKSPRVTSLLPPVLVAIVFADAVVATLSEAFSRLEQEGLLSGAALVSGPSKTADIEMTLVNGVHGPGNVWAFILD